jgi:hypothetical protein
MIHDARVIPIDGRPHLPSSIRQWYGDSIGHWEGDTLVIDTTNFTDQTPFPGAQNLHVIERLKRVDKDTILYQFTVEDPGMWTKPWSGEMPVAKVNGLMYEYVFRNTSSGQHYFEHQPEQPERSERKLNEFEARNPALQKRHHPYFQSNAKLLS